MSRRIRPLVLALALVLLPADPARAEDRSMLEDLLRRLPAELVRSKKSDLEAADALIRAALRRVPTDAEKELLAKHLQKVKDREAGYQDLLWAAMNSTEFVKAHQFANAAEVRQFSEKIVQAWKKK